MNTIAVDSAGRIVGGGVLEESFRNSLPENVIVVRQFPEGDLQDYIYSDGEYVYSPTLKNGGGAHE